MNKANKVRRTSDAAAISVRTLIFYFFYFFSTSEEVGGVLTFVKALLAVHDGNPVSAEAGGPVQLAVVLVQLPIGTAHGFIVGFTVIQALTLPLTRLVVDHTVMPQTAVLVFAWAGEAMVSSDTCGEHTENTWISLLSENLICVLKVPCDLLIIFIFHPGLQSSSLFNT